ncbi:MAG: MBOAT family protein, partial [Planctomycetota bacterium]
MIFPTVQFLLFFILVYGVFRLLPGVMSRQRWLLAASIFFYMAWNPAFILLVTFSVLIDYIAAQRIAAGSGNKGWLVFSLVSNLGFLGWFKYAIFLSGSTCAVLRWFGMEVEAPAWDITLPVGIS